MVLVFVHVERLWSKILTWDGYPSPPILSHHAPNWLLGPVFETSSTSEEKHVSESLMHGVTTHDWFAHYLWDIYGGVGYYGKIIQRTLPSHTQPSRSKLAAWASFQKKLHALRKRNMCVKVSCMVLPPITGLRITFGTYMEALGTMGR